MYDSQRRCKSTCTAVQSGLCFCAVFQQDHFEMQWRVFNGSAINDWPMRNLFPAGRRTPPNSRRKFSVSVVWSFPRARRVCQHCSSRSVPCGSICLRSPTDRIRGCPSCLQSGNQVWRPRIRYVPQPGIESIGGIDCFEWVCAGLSAVLSLSTAHERANVMLRSPSETMETSMRSSGCVRNQAH
jgi:hypothetical protein